MEKSINTIDDNSIDVELRERQGLSPPYMSLHMHSNHAMRVDVEEEL